MGVDRPDFVEGDIYALICRSFDDERPHFNVEGDNLCRIYLKNDATLWVVVDRIDFTFFSKWKWSWSSTPRGKLYAQRSIGGNSYTLGDGSKARGQSRSLYLHRAIQIRTGRIQPTPEHKIVDHRDGNSLDCRRFNLRWSTVSMNNENIPGSEVRKENIKKNLAYLAKRYEALS